MENVGPALLCVSLLYPLLAARKVVRNVIRDARTIRSYR